MLQHLGTSLKTLFNVQKNYHVLQSLFKITIILTNYILFNFFFFPALNKKLQRVNLDISPKGVLVSDAESQENVLSISIYRYLNIHKPQNPNVPKKIFLCILHRCFQRKII